MKVKVKYLHGNIKNMPQCFVRSCGNYYGKTRGSSSKIIYHMLPSDAMLAMKWTRLCGGKQDMKPPPYARVCSAHFSEKCYQRDLQHELLGLPLRRKLNPDAVPDQNLPKNLTKDKAQILKRRNRNDINIIVEKETKSIGKDEPENNQMILKEKDTKSIGKDEPENKQMILKEKDTLNCQIQKNNNRLNRLPMRSSIRIAKKKSIESLSDSFTEKVNNKTKAVTRPERFSDKLVFMAKLQLKHEKNENIVQLPKYDFNLALQKVMQENIMQEISLNKMQIMEDVREGCNVQPSSPGHAEQRVDDVQVKNEPINENGYEEHNSNDHNGEQEVKEENHKEERKSDSENEDKNEENYSNASSLSENNHKRKSDGEDTPIKRLKAEIQDSFITRDKILNEFMELAECNNLEQMQAFSEQILAEIKTLNELAKEKEREWNNIIHLKKIKEELLIRMQRKRQVMLLSDSELSESQCDNSSQPHGLLKSNQRSTLRIPNVDKKQRNILPKPQIDMNSAFDFRQNKQRPILDVQSIIADYRQRHPEAVPRRGRRIRHPHGDGHRNSILNISSMALGSGAQVKQNMHGIDVHSELGLLLSTINGNREGTQGLHLDSSFSQDSNTSFKDMLVQFARLSQNERNELIQNAIKPPPPYPEVTVHPVPTTTAAPTNSLLHGILTKTPTKQNHHPTNNNNNNKTSFSPTLARLLTAPERAVNNHPTSTPTTVMGAAMIHPNNMSISEILSTSKARNEITITPVGNQYDTTPTKGDSMVEEESEEGADRLVIDESSETVNSRKDDNSSDAGDEVPQCQGCNQKPAQFVCAGCGNQWYCSRDCQVSAWDEHSEVCSG